MDRNLYTSDHVDYRAAVAQFVQREVVPNLELWDTERLTGRDVWLAAGAQGIIGVAVPEEFGGPGLNDFRYRMVVCEELARVGAAALGAGFSVHDDIVIPYVAALGTPDQKQRWLPGMGRGELIMAVAMSEPGAGSDLKGIRTSGNRVDGGWIVNGSKTFISSGIQSDLVIVVTKTDAAGGTDAFSLLVVEDGMSGFSRGRKLDKVGLAAQDTAELFFQDVFVPDSNVLGTIGGGFRQLMHHLPQERLSIAAGAMAGADAALRWTVAYTNEREAFGQTLSSFQNTQFTLADISTELDVARAYIDNCIRAANAGTLTAVEAAKAKLWTTELQTKVIDRCLQLFGGYGYMMEYPIARAYLDSRVQQIYGGTSEIMRQIIGRDLTGRR